MNISKILEEISPHDEESEAAALGAMILGGNEICAIGIEELTEDDFYCLKNREAFICVKTVFNSKNNQMDELIIASALEQKGVFDKASSRMFVADLCSKGNAANIEGYCKGLKDRTTQRELIKAGTAILLSARDPAGKSSAELSSDAEALIYGIRDKRNKQEAAPISEVLEKIACEAEAVALARREGREIACPAIPTGYVELDYYLGGGFWPGELCILAARPSMGKTTLAINIARKIASIENPSPKPVAVFSMEMPNIQITKNILAASCGIISSGAKLRKYALNDDEYQNVIGWSEVLKSSPIYIDDSGGLTVDQLRARIRRLVGRYKVELVVVDYLQLLRSNFKRGNRQEEVSEISRNLKAISREMNLPMLVLSQLNRRVEGKDGAEKRPVLSDLRESGAIEQDADVVMMLFREDYCNGFKGTSETECIIQKNRNGEIGTAKLSFVKDQCKFEPYGVS